MFQQNTFKIFLSWVLLFAIVFSVPGFTVSAHFCKGQLKKLSVLSQEDPCKKEQTEACCLHEKVEQVVSEDNACHSDAAHLNEAESCPEANQTDDCCESKAYTHTSESIKAYFQSVSIPNSPILYFVKVADYGSFFNSSSFSLRESKSLLDFKSHLFDSFHIIKCVLTI